MDLSRPYDVAVVGLGAMGAATLWRLATSGARAIGIDMYEPPHTIGSSHGQTRIIREAYYEHPLYVPLVRRAYELWSELERQAGRQLFVRTGGVMVGDPGGVLVRGALASAREHGIDHELLDSDEVHRRWPGLTPDIGMVAVHEKRAGMLLPEPCLEAMLGMARSAGAEVLTGTRMESWEGGADAVRLRTSAGTIAARHVVLATGPWLPAMLAGTGIPLVVERQVFHWMQPLRPELCRAESTPIGLWEYADDRIVATFPDVGGGIKAQIHHEGSTHASPDEVMRETMPEEETRTRTLLARFWPAANGELLDRIVCIYTNTPDHHFLIDRHPADERVILASPCSGHGFKFAPAIGELLMRLTLEGEEVPAASPFRIRWATIARE